MISYKNKTLINNINKMATEYDFERKRKLAESYQKEIDYLQMKSNYEKERKIKQEKDEIFKVQQDLEAENKFNQEKKKALMSFQFQDYLSSLEKKRIKDIERYEDKIKQKNVSLEMKSEERLRQFKSNINRLSDKVDQHAKNYNGYTQENNPNNSTYTDIYRDFYGYPVKRDDQREEQFPQGQQIQSQELNQDQNIRFTSNKDNCSPLNKERVDYNKIKTNIETGETDIPPPGSPQHVGNKTYVKYVEKNKEFEKFNVDLIKQNERFREEMNYRRKLQEEERKKEMEILAQLKSEEKQRDNERKRLYKNLLDEQRKTQVPSKLINESYSLQAATDDHQFTNDYLYNYSPEQYFVNKNKFIDVNPCMK